jgi:succinate-semialdehyde dehydrogenase / glutarate-semialdehyde dehydrogenase
MGFAAVNPATGEAIQRFETLDQEGLEKMVAQAVEAFQSWRRWSYDERAALFLKAADLLEDEKQRWGEIMTLEMGKPIGAAVSEAEKCAWVCRYYAENAAEFLADEIIETDASMSYVRYQPLGPVLAIMPWNFPFWQLFRFAAPGLMAGNVAILKHAANVPQSALAIQEIFDRAGFPPGVFQNGFIEHDQVAALLADPRVKAVTLTGSVRAGKSVAETAGAHLKKVVLELGGSDPFIVMPSADVEKAVKTAVTARMINNGQSCIAAKRFIVHQDIAQEFEDAFVEQMGALQMGDPMNPAVDVGPLAREDLRDELAEQVEESVKAGARLMLGGKVPDRQGAFYPPTVLDNIPEDSPAYKDEMFGPVASVFVVDGVDAAVALANDTVFGLGASVWTTDLLEQERFIAGIESGSVFINGLVKSDPRLPFGGINESGYGRELGVHGIREFVNVKSVWIG